MAHTTPRGQAQGYPISAIAAVYLAALLQGVALVSIPASSSVLKGAVGLTDAQYGAIFLPQVALAVVGALGGGALARVLGLRTLLVVSLVASGLSAVLLALTAVLPHWGYPIALLATACLGAGFGASGAPLNTYAPMFFPQHRDAAVVALHSVIGVGLALGPLAAGGALGLGLWIAFPMGLAVVLGLLTVGSLVARLPRQHTADQLPAVPAPDPDATARIARARPSASAAFWLFAIIAILYAFAEGTFSNWAVIYLEEDRGLSASLSNLALSVFWGALVAGRLLISAVVVRVNAAAIWLSLPVLMIGAFLLLPMVDSAATGIATFALAGAACSAFFPLTISLISKRFPEHVAWVSSVMIAALMVGVGLGTFVIGPLREWLALERLYLVSAAYPLAVLVIGLVVVALSRRPPESTTPDPQDRQPRREHA